MYMYMCIDSFFTAPPIHSQLDKPHSSSTGVSVLHAQRAPPPLIPSRRNCTKFIHLLG